MSDEQYEQPAEEQIHDGIPAEGSDDADDLMTALEVGAQVDPKSGQKMVTVPLGTLVGLRKGSRESAKRIKELEPLAARAKEVDERLAQASPIIDAVLSNPKLRAEAIRTAQGTRTSSESTVQPDDADAVAMAEDLGFYLADGVTPDAARGARVLARVAGKAQAASQDAVRPFAGLALNQQADAHLRQALSMTDNDGTPIATPESIREFWDSMKDAKHLLANPQVVQLIVQQAAGRDRIMGRTPKAQDEPLYMASQNGRRAGGGAVVSAEERAFMKRNGISEKDYLRSTQNLATGVAGRRGIALGGDE